MHTEYARFQLFTDYLREQFFVYLHMRLFVSIWKKALAGLSGLLLVTSCIQRLDPFTGTDGVRANINGDKYVMENLVIYSPVAYCSDNSFSMQASLVHISRSLEPSTNSVLSKSGFSLSISLENSNNLEAGYQYLLGKGKSGEAKLEPLVNNGDAEAISLQGWIRFLSLSPKVVARFELESPGKEYEVRHGLLRLKRK